MRFKDLLLKYKLSGTFLVMSLFLIFIGVTAQYIPQEMARNMHVMYTQRVLATQLLNSCHNKMKDMEVITQALILAPANRATQNTLTRRAEEHFNAIGNLLAEYEQIQSDALALQWLPEFRNELTVFGSAQQTAVEMALAGQQASAYQYYLENGVIHQDNIDALLQVMLTRSIELAEQQNAASKRLSEASFLIIVAFCLTAVMVALLLGRLLNSLITYPLVAMSKEVEEVAAGNMLGLNDYVPIDSQDEVGKLSQGFYRMSQALQQYLTELEEKNRQIYDFAYLDPLTNLPNRRKFIMRLEELSHYCKTGQKSFAILFIDLDRFKDINDTLGHSMGDRVLVAVGERLASSLAQKADTIARWGGDEFTVILNDCADPAILSEIAEQVITAFLQPFEVDGHIFHITTSIGIGIFYQDGQDADSLLRAADTAMFSAKRSGRNSYAFYTEDIYLNLVKRMTMERYLHKALAEKQFEVYYQPKLDLATGEINGIEALVRWNHPEMGFISPADFIPLAEETGLIVPLGLWVLSTACQKNKKLQDCGLKPLRVAVNLSPLQFHQQNLADQVAQVLQHTKLSSEWLELEITEGTLMGNTKETISTLHKLKELGVYISVDDFGTGYSSLEYLQHFPINCLKIDKAFIHTIGDQSENSSIAKAIIGLARSLSLKVVAEGVETAEQLGFLREHQCDEAQGYLFYRPMPVTELELLLRGSR